MPRRVPSPPRATLTAAASSSFCNSRGGPGRIRQVGRIPAMSMAFPSRGVNAGRGPDARKPAIKGARRPVSSGLGLTGTSQMSYRRIEKRDIIIVPPRRAAPRINPSARFSHPSHPLPPLKNASRRRVTCNSELASEIIRILE